MRLDPDDRLGRRGRCIQERRGAAHGVVAVTGSDAVAAVEDRFDLVLGRGHGGGRRGLDRDRSRPASRRGRRRCSSASTAATPAAAEWRGPPGSAWPSWPAWSKPTAAQSGMNPPLAGAARSSSSYPDHLTGVWSSTGRSFPSPQAPYEQTLRMTGAINAHRNSRPLGRPSGVTSREGQHAVSFTHPHETRSVRTFQRTDAPGRGQLSAPLG